MVFDEKGLNFPITMELGRLQEAWLYQLEKLKKGCLMYLLDFGKIYHVREDMNDFFRQSNRELVVEMFQNLLVVWYPLL